MDPREERAFFLLKYGHFPFREFPMIKAIHGTVKVKKGPLAEAVVRKSGFLIHLLIQY
jgi:hypothetical protein